MHVRMNQLALLTHNFDARIISFMVYYAVGFVLFRIADIFKPWPVSWADRKIKGGLGIMLDDVFAGVYAAIVLLALRYWIG